MVTCLQGGVEWSGGGCSNGSNGNSGSSGSNNVSYTSSSIHQLALWASEVALTQTNRHERVHEGL